MTIDESMIKKCYEITTDEYQKIFDKGLSLNSNMITRSYPPIDTSRWYNNIKWNDVCNIKYRRSGNKITMMFNNILGKMKMINYTDNTEITKLQTKLIFSILVAGKSAKFAENKLNRLFYDIDKTPFEYINELIKYNVLEEKLKFIKSGAYKKLMTCLPEVIKLDVKNCDINELEAIKGIGPKTSRFFLMWGRGEDGYAVLDTHVLKWLRNLGYTVTKTTPHRYKYKEIENYFLEEAKKRNISPKELDSHIWDYFNTSGIGKKNMEEHATIIGEPFNE